MIKVWCVSASPSSQGSPALWMELAGARLPGIGRVEPPPGIGHEHHRELQALGAVDGHHGHTAGAGAAGHG